MKKNRVIRIVVIVAIVLAYCVVLSKFNVFADTTTPTPDPGGGGSILDLSGIIDAITNAINAVTNIPQNLFSYLVNSVAAADVLELVTFMTGALTMISSMMAKGDTVFTSSAIVALSTILKPFAYNIMVILFMAGITKKAAYMENMSPSVFFESIGLTLVAKFLIDNSINLLSLISQIFSSITRLVLAYPQNTVDKLYDINNIVGSMQNSVNGDLMNLFGMDLIITLAMIILTICVIIIFIVLVARQIELGVLAIAAPLFMATVASSISNDVIRGFLKYFISVVAQTLFMSIAIVIFVSSVFGYVQGTGTGIFGGFLEMIIGVVGLSFYMIKMPNSIKHILGAGGGSGGGFSIASVVQFAALLL